MIQTLDFFTPVVDDPYLFGQIAAANSLSDVYAMGGEPKVALNIVCFPNCLDPDILGEILRGGADKVLEAGAVLVGGHSVQDDEPKYGLSVTGFVHPDKIYKNYGCQPGDVLVLTKQLGSGIVNTTVKAQMASEAAADEAAKVMASLNQRAKRAIEKHTIHACTDVTGFGLLGHCTEMAEASDITLELYPEQIEYMTEAIAYLREFHFASVVLRLALAMLLGGCIGLERERKRRPAGFRTYMLVCLGAALTVLLSLYEYTLVTGPWSALAAELGMKTDVSRFGAQVINGIGFLGAGTILVTGRQQVKGLTTAAGLWASACTGLAVGAGFYECVLIAFAMIFLSIRLFPIVDAYIQENARDINLYLEFNSMDDVSTIINQLKAQNVQIYDIDIERNRSGEQLHPSSIFSIRLNEKIPHTQLLSELAGLDCLCAIEEL
jgi:putative Mg2+ transporter-C (MgtC) family protein